jgi:hypothetical protein
LRAGVYCIVEVAQGDAEVPDAHPQFDAGEGDVQGIRPRVRVRVTQNLLDNPVVLESLREGNILNGRYYHASREVPRADFEEVLNLIEG